MHTWFECKVKYTKKDEQSGKEKKVSEPYLVDALSFTEAESRITEELEQIISGGFELANISRYKLNDVFFYETGDKWYKCKVSFIDLDPISGKEKKVNVLMLVFADNVKEACDRLDESLATMVVPYVVLSVTESPLADLFPYFSDDEADEADDSEPSES